MWAWIAVWALAHRIASFSDGVARQPAAKTWVVDAVPREVETRAEEMDVAREAQVVVERELGGVANWLADGEFAGQRGRFAQCVLDDRVVVVVNAPISVDIKVGPIVRGPDDGVAVGDKARVVRCDAAVAINVEG